MKQNTIAKILSQATIIVALTFVFLLILNWIPKLRTSWLDAETMLKEELQFSDLYFNFHKHLEIPSYNGRYVYLLDIHKAQNRKEIAEIINHLADAQPYLVAMDVYFGETAMPDSVENQQLIKSLQRLPNLIYVMSYNPSEDLYNHSFFASELDPLYATEALSNFLPQSPTRTWKANMLIGGDTVPTFAAVIAQKMGAVISDTGQEWLIDYSIDDSGVCRMEDPIDYSVFHNHVVIIGDARDPKDTHQIPTSILSKESRCGVIVHKQILETILSNHWMRPISPVWRWIIIFIFLWITLLGEMVISLWLEKRTKWTQNKVLHTYRLFITLIVVFISYCLFWKTGWYINMLEPIFAVAMLWFGKWGLEKYNNIKFRKA